MERNGVKKIEIPELKIKGGKNLACSSLFLSPDLYFDILSLFWFS